MNAVEDAGGAVVKSLGDGVMATFGSAEAAVAGARAIQQRIDNADASEAIGGRVVRVGISGGDAVERDGDWFGVAVVEAARLCAVAEGGQILAAQVVWLLTSPEARNRWRAARRALAQRTVARRRGAVRSARQPAESRAIGVIIADDSALLLRSGIARVLNDNGLRVLGEAGDGEELVMLVAALHPDVVIIDIRMPPTFNLEGIHAAEAIRAPHPEIGILVLSQHVECGLRSDYCTSTSIQSAISSRTVLPTSLISSKPSSK